MNPPPHAPRQHEPPDPAADRSCEVLAEEDRTASTPAPLKGSLIVIACTQTIDRIVKEERRGIDSTPDATGRSDSP